MLDEFHMPWSTFLPARLVDTAGRQWIDDLHILLGSGSRRHRIEFRWENQYVLPSTSTRVNSATKPSSPSAKPADTSPKPSGRNACEQIFSLYSQDELHTLRDRFSDFAPLNWQQARDLQAAGVDVGSHGLSHIALAPQSPEIIRHELTAARDLLQQNLGDHSPHFSYPYGRQASFSEETERQLVEMGYHCALTLEQNAIDCHTQNLMQLPRLIVSPLIGRVLFGLWQRFIR